MIKNKNALIYVYAFTIFILFLIVISNITIGSVKIELEEIYKILFKNIETENYQILKNIRLPRVAYAIIAGVGLAISGHILQIVLRNPMADSGSLGISAGASFATTLVLLVVPLPAGLIPLISFIGGIGAFLLILMMSWEVELTPTRLILTGAALNAMLRGGQSFLMTMYSDRLQGVISWQNGNFAGKTWDQMGVFLIYLLPAIAIIFLVSNKINILNLSDSTSYSLGVNTRKYRILVSALAVYIAAVTVSQVGMIGFVGLIIPHMSKMVLGANIKKSLPFTILLGSILLMTADLFSRVAFSPIEIPIATVMSIIGGTFFLYLVAKKSKGIK